MVMKPSLISVASTGHVVLLERRMSRSQTSAYKQRRKEDGDGLIKRQCKNRKHEFEIKINKNGCKAHSIFM